VRCAPRSGQPRQRAQRAAAAAALRSRCSLTTCPRSTRCWRPCPTWACASWRGSATWCWSQTPQARLCASRCSCRCLRSRSSLPVPSSWPCVTTASTCLTAPAAGRCRRSRLRMTTRTSACRSGCRQPQRRAAAAASRWRPAAAWCGWSPSRCSSRCARARGAPRAVGFVSTHSGEPVSLAVWSAWCGCLRCSGHGLACPAAGCCVLCCCLTATSAAGVWLPTVVAGA
jgi:hypothetical protein